jgi:hypothetical protein
MHLIIVVRFAARIGPVGFDLSSRLARRVRNSHSPTNNRAQTGDFGNRRHSVFSKLEELKRQASAGMSKPGGDR